MPKLYKTFDIIHNIAMIIAVIVIVIALFQKDLESDFFDMLATILFISIAIYWISYILKKIFKP